MPGLDKGIKPEQILEIALLNRWLILTPLFFTLIVGIYLAFTLPEVYRSETLILVQSQKVPSNFVRSTVSTDINERVSTLSQQIMSRTNLEKIIDDFKLFSGPGGDKMYVEDKIAALRAAISVKVTGNRSRGAAFSISYMGKDPETVMKITNTLTTFFIDENLKLREAHAKGTSDFLEDNLSKMRARLEQLEGQIKEYSQRYLGELPEHLAANLRILEGLQMQLRLNEERTRDISRQLTLLENQAIQARQNRSVPITSSADGETGEEVPLEYAKLAELEQRLVAYRLRYTDQHPDVIRLKRIVERLRAKLEKDAEAAGMNEEAPPGKTSGPPIRKKTASSLEIQLDIQRVELEEEKRTIAAEVAKLIKDITVYQERVENTPKRKQELLSIRRDYNNIKDAYDSLLSRKHEAELSVNMERKQKGERFRVLDSAKLPTKPVKPDLKKLFILSVAAGLGLGGGLTFVKEFLNTSFKSPGEVEGVLGLPLLITIPDLRHLWKSRLKKRFNLLMSIAFLLVVVGLALVFMAIIAKGPDNLIEAVRTRLPM